MPSPKTALRQLVIEFIAPSLRRHSISPDEVDDSLNIVERGIVDSIEFLNLVARLEQKADVELELFDVDPAVLTTVGGLTDLVYEATASCTSSRSMTHE